MDVFACLFGRHFLLNGHDAILRLKIYGVNHFAVDQLLPECGKRKAQRRGAENAEGPQS